MEQTVELRHFEALILKVRDNFREGEIRRIGKWNMWTSVDIVTSAA